jgi:hypothetical protein
VTLKDNRNNIHLVTLKDNRNNIHLVTLKDNMNNMNVIPVVFEITRWMLFLLSLRVPDECYSCCL